MDGSYYLFALYVAALIAALFLLSRWYSIRSKARRASEDDADAKGKEQRLFSLYQNIEEMMDNFEAYVEDTREQMESIRGQIQQQADYFNGLLQRVEAAEAGARQAVAAMRAADKPEPEKEPLPPAEPVKRAAEPGRRATRAESVRELMGKGLTVEQVAAKLELSINEVRLIVYGLMTKSAEGR